MIDPQVQSAIAELLAAADRSGPFELQVLHGGANNRVYRVDQPTGPLVAKQYFRHRGDRRDRLGAEYGFIRFAWDYGIRCIPQPLVISEQHGLALYGFLDGRPATGDDVTDDNMQQAIDFVSQLNRHRDRPTARTLPNASEACFSAAEHAAMVDRRLTRLQSISPQDDTDRQMRRFVGDELRPACQQAIRRLTDEAVDFGPPVDRVLPQRDRRLSPSDFGFHNAIISGEGRVQFYDFEYAGWDDPAKLVCDFFCQVQVPAPMRYFDPFARGALEGVSRIERHLHRIRLLLPLYRVKWCCIVLNEFLPVGEARRAFAGDHDVTRRKADQLAKARQMLATMLDDLTP